VKSNSKEDGRETSVYIDTVGGFIYILVSLQDGRWYSGEKTEVV